MIVGNEVEARKRVARAGWRPRNCVWELTLACNLRCTHCGSRAGKARARELTLAECLDVAAQLADLGAELVTLSGGEPTLRRDWDVIAAALVRRGLRVNMVTNGAYASERHAREIARRAVAAGLCNVGLSIDGPAEVHEAIRGPGTLARTLAAMAAFRAEGLPVGVLTTVGRANLHHLEAVRTLAIEHGAAMWRLQLAKPMGAMAEHANEILAPEDLLYLVPLLARMKARGGLHVTVGDSIGYYGEHDEALRGRGWRGRAECWQGCQAGLQAIGIQADGGVKGCLSLQAFAHGETPDAFVEGNLRESSLDALWHRPGAFAYNREPVALTGACAGCRFGKQCRGGARCVSSATLGVVTEDPWCYTAVAAARGVVVEPPARGVCRAAMLAISLIGAAACDEESEPPGREDAELIPRDLGGQDSGRVDLGRFDRVPPGDAAPASDAAPPPPRDVLPPPVDVSAPPPDRPVVDASAPPADASAPPPDRPLADASAPPPDLAPPPADAGPDMAIDCTAVCCACEYGIIPPEVWETCCAPCQNVCCECDYGEPPPPQCCP